MTSIEEYARRVAQEAPPLTDSQRARLAAILAGDPLSVLSGKQEPWRWKCRRCSANTSHGRSVCASCERKRRDELDYEQTLAREDRRWREAVAEVGEAGALQLVQDALTQRLYRPR